MVSSTNAIVKHYRVASLGDLVVDLVASIPRLPVEPDGHQVARAVELQPGGAGNFLIAGTRLGMQMAALGVTGDDAFGRAMVEALAEEGVLVDGIIVQPGGSTTIVLVLVDDRGRHVFLGCYGSGPELPLPQIWRERLQETQAVFVPGYTFHDRRITAACLQALSLARQHGAQIFFDPGPEASSLDSGLIEEILSLSDCVLLTEAEIPMVSRGEAGQAAARAPLERGLKLVCVKRGARGCVILSKTESTDHPGFVVPVRDTAAAGDAFAAAFIFAALSHWPLASVAAFANAMGAAKVQKLGSGTQVPTAAELRSVLRENKVELDF